MGEASQVKAAANWSCRLSWVSVRHGQWRVAVVASQFEHVSITSCVRTRVVGRGSPHLPQPGAMADASNVRHDTIVVPERMSPA